MSCYRSGGCGPYEMRSCSECPASKPEYAQKNARFGFGETDAKFESEATEPKQIKIKAFLDEDGVMCVLTNAGVPVEIEFIDAVAVENETRDNGEEVSEENDPVNAYINQLCADGFVYVPDENITVTNMLYEG